MKDAEFTVLDLVPLRMLPAGPDRVRYTRGEIHYPSPSAISFTLS
jgi:hypothetical protein